MVRRGVGSFEIREVVGQIEDFSGGQTIDGYSIARTSIVQ
jgi:hypothetical protein